MARSAKCIPLVQKEDQATTGGKDSSSVPLHSTVGESKPAGTRSLTPAGSKNGPAGVQLGSLKPSSGGSGTVDDSYDFRSYTSSYAATCVVGILAFQRRHDHYIFYSLASWSETWKPL